MNIDNEETKRQWVKRVTSGERSPIDHLTTGERDVLNRLRQAGYEIAPESRLLRYIRKAEAA
jgi:hypothetical protein